MTAEYRVELGQFFGPLDLLLYLVRRSEVDVLDLSVSTITARFLDYLSVLEFIDFDQVGEFLVMASTLVEIKSRSVLPKPEEETEPEVTEDPRGELIQQLLSYKKFKDASLALEERAAQWQERFPRLSDDRPAGGKDPALDRIKEVELWDLVSALTRVLRKQTVTKETTIQFDDTPIAVYSERIRERIRREGRVAFSEFFENTNTRSKIVGVFLAILELLRHHHYRAEQPVDFGEIWILPPLSADGATADAGDTTGDAAPPTDAPCSDTPDGESPADGRADA